MSTRFGNQKTDLGVLSRDLADCAEAFCAHYFPNGRKQGNYWQIGDTSGAAGQSLAIRLHSGNGRKAGNWTDYANGEYGDLLDLLHENLGASGFADTIKEARSFLGETPSEPNRSANQSPAETTNKRITQARKLFEYGKPTYRTLASAYLLKRGIQRFGPALRYHPTVFVRTGENDDAELEKRPALLGKITNNEGAITGVARTFLDPHTKRVADMESPKRILGPLHGNAIRFGVGAYPEELIAGEGLENVLSVGTALPDSDLASCLTANHLGMFIPPVTIKRLWIARDNDKAGKDASDRLRERAKKSGLWCGELVPKQEDFNKDLVDYGVERLRIHLESSMKKQLSG